MGVRRGFNIGEGEQIIDERLFTSPGRLAHPHFGVRWGRVINRKSRLPS